MRVFLIVLDGVGVGNAPDAAEYGDEGANTLGGISSRLSLRLPALSRAGLGLTGSFPGIPAVSSPRCAVALLQEVSRGKDTVTGHWEMMGVTVDEPFPTFPDGFPPEVMDEFVERTGYGYLWNRPASGTEIIERLGEEHISTGKLIVYTSADSVFQIAAHEDVVPVEELYRVCRVAREILNPYRVLRVIARPFVGEPGKFVRTERRRDFPLPPPEETALDVLSRGGVEVISVGKVSEMFGGRGFSKAIKVKDNSEAIRVLNDLFGNSGDGVFVFANLNDFDTLYGHRNDVEGFARALEEFDEFFSFLLEELGEEDLLIVTADHGNDPTYPGTDHTRELVPLLALGGKVVPGFRGKLRGFQVVGRLVLEHFGLPVPFRAESLGGGSEG